MIGHDDGSEEPGGPRIRTGNPPLDGILAGGFPAHSINIVMGHPGTGKTIFVEQLLFHNASDERPALYLTTLSEPLSKVMTYLQQFGFFDPGKLGSQVIYEDVGPGLVERGVGYLLERVREVIREIGPGFIVIDSFKAVHDLSDSPREMRKLLWDLAGVLSSYNTTAFLVGEYSEEHIPLFPEFAVADGILEFTRFASAKRDDRFVRVLKLRGSPYAEGFHAFTITPDGLRVFPRLVSPIIPEEYTLLPERMATGVAGLDEILEGGLWRGSNLLVTGPTGAGKTTLGLGFALAGVRAGQPTLYCSFQENPTQLVRTVAPLGGSMEDLHDQGLHMLYTSPVELQIDRVVGDLFERIRAHDIERVVVDSLGDLAIATGDAVRFHDCLYALSQHFVVRGITSLMILEAHRRETLVAEPRLSAICDAIVDLGVELGVPPRRTLRVVKARGIAHDLAAHEMVIETGGVRLALPGGTP